MSYYSNEVENTKDYLEGKYPMIKDLMDIEAKVVKMSFKTRCKVYDIGTNNL